LSRYHREHPLIVNMDGHGARIDFEPGESRTIGSAAHRRTR
jgi:hypothetical protein